MEKAAAKTPSDWGADPSDLPLVDTDKIVINYTISQLTFDIVRDTDPKWFIDATKIDPNERLTPQQTAFFDEWAFHLKEIRPNAFYQLDGSVHANGSDPAILQRAEEARFELSGIDRFVVAGDVLKQAIYSQYLSLTANNGLHATHQNGPLTPKNTGGLRMEVHNHQFTIGPKRLAELEEKLGTVPVEHVHDRNTLTHTKVQLLAKGDTINMGDQQVTLRIIAGKPTLVQTKKFGVEQAGTVVSILVKETVPTQDELNSTTPKLRNPPPDGFAINPDLFKDAGIKPDAFYKLHATAEVSFQGIKVDRPQREKAADAVNQLLSENKRIVGKELVNLFGSVGYLLNKNNPPGDPLLPLVSFAIENIPLRWPNENFTPASTEIKGIDQWEKPEPYHFSNKTPYQKALQYAPEVVDQFARSYAESRAITRNEQYQPSPRTNTQTQLPNTTTIMEPSPKTAIATNPNHPPLSLDEVKNRVAQRQEQRNEAIGTPIEKTLDGIRAEPFSVSIDSIKGGRFQIAQIKDQILDKFQSEGGMVKETTAKTIEEMLKGRRSDLSVMNDMSVGKLYITNVPNKGPQVQQINAAANLTIPDTYVGHTFTPADKENLMRFANMGRRVELTAKAGNNYMGYVGVDKDTKTLVILPAKNFRIPDTIKGVALNPKQKETLAEGKALRLFDMKGPNGNYAAYVRIDAAKQSLRFDGIDNTKKAAFQKIDTAPAQAQPATHKNEPVQKALSKKTAEAPAVSDKTTPKVDKTTAPRINTEATGPKNAPRANKDATAPKEAPAKKTAVAKPKKSKGVNM